MPHRVVVSPARRARETWQLAAGEVPGPPEPDLEERIYRNTVEDLLEVLHETPAGIETLVLVGHNPSMEQLALALDDGRGPAPARRELARKYPTSGVAVFAVDGNWSAIDRGGGTLVGFTVPRG